MFDEVSKLIKDLIGLSEDLARIAESSGNYFHAYALAEAYNYLMGLADERMQTHPEVQRVPELRTILLRHLYENADKHINLPTDRIFNSLLLGSPKSLADWQEAGYHAVRTASNYPSRLRSWISIYDGTPIKKKSVRVSRNPNDIFAGIEHAAEVTDKQPRNKKNEIVTYEDVIRKRNSAYTATESAVPWWMVFNYGTKYAGRDGYPSFGGLHFVEDAERDVPMRLVKYSQLYEQFMSDAIDGRIDRDLGVQSAIELWVSRNVAPAAEFIPSADLARIITFGVPF